MRRFVCGILARDGKILLGKRNPKRTAYPGVWDFIGGHCEEHESIEKGLKRELFEELGIHPIHFERINTVERAPDFILYIYWIRQWEGVPYNRDPGEHEILAWFSFTEAKTLNFPDSAYEEILTSIAKRITS